MVDTDPPNMIAFRNIGGVSVAVPLDVNAAFVLNDAIVPIPEPSSVVLLALGLTLLSACCHGERRRSPFLSSGRGSSGIA